MKYLLDTDHLSIIQREVGQDYMNLSNRIAQYPLSDFAVSVVTFYEQMLGSHAYINRARSPDRVVKGYEIIARILKDFTVLPVIQFNSDAAVMFENIQSQGIQIATMDLRIAVIALSQNLILLTRNSRDFGKVPELVTEDWTTNKNIDLL